jgi:lipoate-protein ligase B
MFVDLLEETMILVLADFGIQAGREPEHRGVWVGDLKVAALGVAIRRWVSFHGIALNVSPNMGHFCHINPCELGHEQVTSMANFLEQVPSLPEVSDAVVRRFTQLFPTHWQALSSAELFHRITMGDEISHIGGMQV